MTLQCSAFTLLSGCRVEASRKLERQGADSQGGSGSHSPAGGIQKALGAKDLKCLKTR